ncbi:MAG: AbrB/MazE/SpoVT family DNA-binding domain-containing protein [Clostridia bacterium]|nr:AbrB/MazE/SpoVT family DNA-binding domain-containing protein [Clostridia bacterium]
MKMEKGKFIWTTKVSNKGQIVIPKQARDEFNIKEGDTLIMFGDKEKGIALAKYDDYLKFAEAIFNANKGDN